MHFLGAKCTKIVFRFWPRLSSGPYFGKYDTPPNFVVDWGGEYPFLISLSRQHIRCLDAQSGFYDYE